MFEVHVPQGVGVQLPPRAPINVFGPEINVAGHFPAPRPNGNKRHQTAGRGGQFVSRSGQPPRWVRASMLARPLRGLQSQFPSSMWVVHSCSLRMVTRNSLAVREYSLFMDHELTHFLIGRPCVQYSVLSNMQ